MCARDFWYVRPMRVSIANETSNHFSLYSQYTLIHVL